MASLISVCVPFSLFSPPRVRFRLLPLSAFALVEPLSTTCRLSLTFLVPHLLVYPTLPVSPSLEALLRLAIRIPSGKRYYQLYYLVTRREPRPAEAEPGMGEKCICALAHPGVGIVWDLERCHAGQMRLYSH